MVARWGQNKQIGAKAIASLWDYGENYAQERYTSSYLASLAIFTHNSTEQQVGLDPYTRVLVSNPPFFPSRGVRDPPLYVSCGGLSSLYRAALVCGSERWLENNTVFFGSAGGSAVVRDGAFGARVCGVETQPSRTTIIMFINGRLNVLLRQIRLETARMFYFIVLNEPMTQGWDVVMKTSVFWQ